MNIVVKDTTGLVSALKSAQAGDQILLAPGIYAPALIQNANFSGAVTIKPLNAEADTILTGLTLRNSSNINIQGLEFSVDPKSADYPLQVVSSSNIRLSELNIHGTLDGNAQNDASGLMIRSSQNVTVTNSEFHELKSALAHLDNNNITIANNSFHDIRIDGVKGGGSSNVLVKGNTFTNFNPMAGDHADAIQFWTTNTVASASNITVVENVIVRGDGAPIQGLHMIDQVGDLPYQNVTVANNLMMGTLYHGIFVENADKVNLTGNQVVSFQDQKSWIKVTESSGVSLSNNSASQFTLEGNEKLTEINDKIIAAAADGGQAIFQNWMASLSIVNTAMSKEIMTAIDASRSSIAAMRQQVLTVNGTTNADRLTVDAVKSTVLDSGAGNDVLTGGGIGRNTLVGGDGDDTYIVRSVFDQVFEQNKEGDDYVIASVNYVLPDFVERLQLTGDAFEGVGNDLANRIIGGRLNDALSGLGGGDLIQGNEGNDKLFGGAGSDSLQGGAGTDTLDGDVGADNLAGGEGGDSLSGGAGADTLEGGAGVDQLAGGAGADVFRYRDGDLGLLKQVEKIFDFSSADGDKIALTSMDANTVLAGNNNFTFIGQSAFHKVAGELRYEVSGGSAHVMADLNGDGIADFQLALPGVGTLKSSDFFL